MVSTRQLLFVLLAGLMCGAAVGQDFDPDLPPVETEPGEPVAPATSTAGAPADKERAKYDEYAEGVDLPPPSISEEEVEEAIRLKVKYLYSRINDQGHWEDFPSREALAKALAAGDRTIYHDRDFGGRSALVVLALLYAGEDYQSDVLRKALAFLAETEFKGTYVSGIRASMWAKIKDQKFRDRLKVDAQYLLDAAMTRDGVYNGFFTYTKPGRGSGDHSNTQYGVLGLRDAALRGIEVPIKFWEAVEKHMIELQFGNGGWAYRTIKGDISREPYGNMTVACLANLYITLERLSPLYEGRFNGRSAKGCGHRKPPQAIEMGKAWLDEHLPGDFGLVPGDRKMNLYYAYGLERCANASGRKTFGGINWFEEGAKWIIRRQKPDGSHGDFGWQCGTSWALLFLCKGRGPVLFNKLDTGGDWMNDVLDIPNLSRFFSNELEQRVNWQVVDIKDDVRTWLDAPILFLNGHEPVDFTDEQKRKLRLYTDSGGTIVAEACCSKIKFVRWFRDLAKEIWPEWELELLDRRHPVMTSHYTIVDRLPRTFHINDGCRSRVFLITEDMSCAWQQNIRTRYKHYFEFGMNLARCASDKRMLRSRLFFHPWELDELRAKGKAVPSAPIDRGRVKLVDWPTDGRRLTDIRAMRHLRETMDQGCNVALETVACNDHVLDKLDGARVLHMSGHHTFAASDENVAKIREFLNRGGLLWADAQCGRKSFNESFAKFLEKLLPGAELRDVMQVDPVLTGQGLTREGFDVTRVRYKRVHKFNKFQPELKEVRLDGRRVILYSPYDLTCGLDGHDCWGCEGLERNDALKLSANILLSAMEATDVQTDDADTEEESAAPSSSEPLPFRPRDMLPAPE